MPVSMSQVLATIDKDEPDYGAATKLGPDALPHLRQLVEADDAMRAAKAAHLAGLIGGAQAAPVLELAAAHRDPTVRVAAAHALGAGTDTPTSLLERLLDDRDVGVRKVALRAAKTAKRSQLRNKVSAMAKDDPDEYLREVAKDVAREL
jgi:HEAT repeat protein